MSTPRLMQHVCVFAGSSAGRRPAYTTAAADLGRALAAREIELVYGGARVGLMGILADAVLASGGRVFGVIPAALALKEVAHDGLTELRVVQSMHERKALMADRSDGFIALPGGLGTWEEFFEILTWGQLGLHRKPCGLLNVGGYFDPLLCFVAHAVAEGFVTPEHAAMISVASAPEALLGKLATATLPVVEKWLDRAST
ncbi:MAG TPA: TIGR00730 family Rossman fold protein [Vicinamibacterales bacterium]|nr:TIGR00730 family Rossman fold protein [Vicinamibacterales bacterium]